MSFILCKILKTWSNTSLNLILLNAMWVVKLRHVALFGLKKLALYYLSFVRIKDQLRDLVDK